MSMSIAPVLNRALRDGSIFAGAVAVVGAVVGFLVAGWPGLVGGLLGAVASAIFLGLTAASMLVGGRITKGDLGSPVFFGIVLGTWLIKLVLFVVLAIWLRSQTWLDPRVFFLAVIVSVIGSLAIDVLAFARSRVPYVSDVQLPGDSRDGDEPRNHLH
jgi:hypothetical protein